MTENSIPQTISIKLLSPYATLIFRDGKNPYTACHSCYQLVIGFPEEWEALPQSFRETPDPLPSGEYCWTTDGIYRRKQGGAR